MSYDENVYYHPEKHDLEKVLEGDRSSGDYEFDILCIWRGMNDKKLYYATDSGCSCPSPFEDHNGLDSLTPILPETLDVFETEALAKSYGGACYLTQEEVQLIRNEVLKEQA